MEIIKKGKIRKLYKIMNSDLSLFAFWGNGK